MECGLCKQSIQGDERYTVDHYRCGAELAQSFRDDIARVEQQRDELVAAIRTVVEQFGPWHDDDCPGDDTCDCSAKPIHDAVNAAVRNAEGS